MQQINTKMEEAKHVCKWHLVDFYYQKTRK